MSLLDTLLSTPAEKFSERKTAVFHSKRLEEICGDGDITVQEIPYKRMQHLQSLQFDKKGHFDLKLSARAKAKMVVEGIIVPNLRDEKLLEHFDAPSPADLAEKLFSNEITPISDKIMELSGYEDEDEEEAEETDEEIKNS